MPPCVKTILAGHDGYKARDPHVLPTAWAGRAARPQPQGKSIKLKGFLLASGKGFAFTMAIIFASERGCLSPCLQAAASQL